MTLKMKVIGYWVTTALIALETLAGGVTDLMHGRTNLFSGPHVVDVVTSLGYPVYLLAILGIWKIPGAIVLVVPGFLRLKEWAYAGIVFELSGARAAAGGLSDFALTGSKLCRSRAQDCVAGQAANASHDSRGPRF